jgi:hypothetical protein
MQSPRPEGHGFEVALGALLVVAAILVIAKTQANALRDELDSERKRRLEAEEKARSHDANMNGALEKIQELKDRVDELAG